MAEVKAYLVPFSHMDLFWLGAQEECLSRGNRVISEAMDLVAKHPEFRFLIEDLVFVDHFLRCHPEKREALKECLARGQMEVGPKWAGIDQTPQLGEDLVRNGLYAMRYLERELGYTARTMHTGDLPGWTPQYPQILSKLGIPYAVYTRTGPTDVSLFNWVGLDGTRVLVWYSLNGYGWAWHGGGLEISVEKAKANGLETTMRQVIEQGVSPIFVHWGVDLILPGRKLPENLRAWNRESPLTMAFATPTQYFEAAPKDGLRELAGEVPSAWPYSEPQYPESMVFTFPAVSNLLDAERYAAFAWLHGHNAGFPAEKIRESWLLTLEAMDHNNNGQGYDQTRERKRDYYQTAARTGASIREDALRRIAEKVESPFGSAGYPIVVFNPMTWQRSDVVRTHATFHGDLSAFDIAPYRQLSLVDDQGSEVPFQASDIREGVARELFVSFIAKDVPANGYRTWYLRPTAAQKTPQEAPQEAPRQAQASAWEWNGLELRTPFYTFTLNEVTGDLSLADLRTGRQRVKRMYVVALEEKLDNGSFRDETTGRRFESVLESAELVDAGDVSATLRLVSRVAETRIEQRVTVYQELERIDIANNVDFTRWRPMRLCQVFETDMAEPSVAYGVPYGANRMENVLPNCSPHRFDEMPAESWRKLRYCIRWLDLSDARGGLTIAGRHRCYSIEGGTVSAVMLRPVVSTQCVYIRDGKRVRHERPYPGSFAFTYSLVPHSDDWVRSRSYRAGWDHNHPLLPVVVGDSFTKKSLPPSGRFLDLRADTESVILDVVKKAEDGEDLVVRFHETEGRAGQARVSVPGRTMGALWVTDLRERPVRQLDAAASIPYRAFEIVTLRLTIGKQRS